VWTDLRRKNFAEQELKRTGNLVKVEDYDNKIGRSERTNAIIEPKLSMQWFLKMKDISKPALDAVLNGDVQLHPAKFKKSVSSLDGKCARLVHKSSVVVGHRIPAWYYNNNEFVVANDINEALLLARKKKWKFLNDG